MKYHLKKMKLILSVKCLTERKIYKTQKKVDENNKIIENQAIKIEKNNIEINNQIKKFNEMKDIQKQLPQLHEKAKQKAITELKESKEDINEIRDSRSILMKKILNDTLRV